MSGQQRDQYKNFVKDCVGDFTVGEGDSDQVKEARDLVTDFLTESVGESTSSSYQGAWDRFKAFCAENGRQFLPASEETVCLHLAYIAKKNMSVSPSLQMRAAIGHFHRMKFPDSILPTEGQRVTQLMMGIKRKYNKPVCKSKPMTPEIMKKLLTTLGVTEENTETLELKEQRMAAFSSILFFCCARYEEVANLKLNNLNRTQEGNLEIVFEKAKNNQFGAAKSSVIRSMGNGICPVKIVWNYKERIELAYGSDDKSLFLFPSLTPKSEPKKGTRFSYDNSMKRLREALVKIGFSSEEAKKFGMHSYRVGAATSAFASGQMSDTSLQMVGRWNSGATPKTYIVPTEEERGKMSAVLQNKMS